MSDAHPFIETLRDEARACEQAEDEFRRTMRERVAELAEARAFANRRMNVMRALLETAGRHDDRAEAVKAACSELANRLGWREESAAREEVLAEYAKLAATAHAATHQETDGADVPAALAEFEAWYLTARGKPFWVLFEHYMPETQLVDF